MAMFDKHKSSRNAPSQPSEPEISRPAAPTASAPAAAPSKVAMIGQGIRISGDVQADTNLKIEGVIEGRVIESTMNVEIGDSGAVKASIIAKNVSISGEVVGDIGGSEKVMISRSGKVQGNIVAPRVQLEDGALFRGTIDMNPGEQAAAAKPASNAAPQAAKKATAKAPAKAASDDAKDRQEPSLTLKSG